MPGLHLECYMQTMQAALPFLFFFRNIIRDLDALQFQESTSSKTHPPFRFRAAFDFESAWWQAGRCRLVGPAVDYHNMGQPWGAGGGRDGEVEGYHEVTTASTPPTTVASSIF